MENAVSRIVDALPGIVWTALPDGDLDFVNGRWCEYTGLGVDKAYGREWETVIHPDDRHALIERWQGILHSGAPGEMEARLRRVDGEYRWFVFRVCPLPDEIGRIAKWCVLITDIETRRRSEEELRGRWWLSPIARERHFNAIVNDVPNLATMMTPTGYVEMVNRQVLEYYGATLQEIRTWEISDTVHPEDQPNVLSAWSKAVETGVTYDVESRLRRADGAYRWFHTRGFALKDTQERTVFWYLLQNDIDDRRRAEALLADEKRLLEMVTGARSMSEIFEALCRLVERTIGGCYCSVFLIDPTGTHLQNGIAPNLPASFTSAAVDVSIDSGPCAMSAYLNEQVIVADFLSESRWAASGFRQMALEHQLRACWAIPICSASGEVLGVFAIYYGEPKIPTPHEERLVEQLKHIASIAVERVTSDAALRQSEAFLAQGQRLSSTGSFLWRVATNEITWSEQIYRIFEFDPTIPVTLDLIATRVHPGDMPMMLDMVGRARGDGSDFEYEHRLLMPDGSVKYLHLIGQSNRGHHGQLEYLGAVQDITKRRRSERALEEVRSELAHVARVASLGALTASIAHEVNQPLSGILTNASTCLRMLAADPPNVEGARETARRTIRDGNRASDVITRLRALFTKRDPVNDPIDLNEATNEVLALLRNEFQRCRVDVRLVFDDTIPLVMGDRVQLQQVILNLLRNAADAMTGIEDRPRLLTVRTEREGNEGVCLCVQDSGVGFNPQDMGRLFDAFYSTKSGGMGIGLSVSRSIIESHRGRLWAVLNEGHPGATFAFRIPQALPMAADLRLETASHDL